MTTPSHDGWCPPVQKVVRRELWPFYLDRRQRALLRDAWGEDAVIQIYGGCVRIRSEHGDRLFHCEAELCSTIFRRKARSSV